MSRGQLKKSGSSSEPATIVRSSRFQVCATENRSGTKVPQEKGAGQGSAGGGQVSSVGRGRERQVAGHLGGGCRRALPERIRHHARPTVPPHARQRCSPRTVAARCARSCTVIDPRPRHPRRDRGVVTRRRIGSVQDTCTRPYRRRRGRLSSRTICPFRRSSSVRTSSPQRGWRYHGIHLRITHSEPTLQRRRLVLRKLIVPRLCNRPITLAKAESRGGFSVHSAAAFVSRILT